MGPGTPRQSFSHPVDACLMERYRMVGGLVQLYFESGGGFAPRSSSTGRRTVAIP